MNEAYESLLTRRSWRKFANKPVPEDLIASIVKAGEYAASARSLQSPLIIKISNPQLREKFVRANAAIMGCPEGFDPFYGAPVMLVVLVPADNPNGVYDGSLTMGNLMQAAHDLGLGSIWIHRAREEFEMEEFKQFLIDVGVEDSWVGVGHCAIGWPDGPEPKAASRKLGRYIDADKVLGLE